MPRVVDGRASVADRRGTARAPRVVARKRQRPRSGLLHGVLVYVAGTLALLSTVYGVAHSVGDGNNVLTDSAAAFRSMCFGEESAADDTPDRSPETPETPESGESASSVTAPTEAAPVPVEVQNPEDPTPEAGASQGATAAASSPAVAAPSGQSVAAPTAEGVVANGDWLSGASGDDIPDGSFGAWRGTPVEIAGTWADSNEGQLELWALTAEYGDWNAPLEIAIGAIDDGESWQEAAGGAYDDRWRQSLTNMKNDWGSRTAPLFIRFAHEMNGDWYPWSVNADNHTAFIESWKRFRTLQQEIFPASRLVFGLNRESVGSGIDWRETFPGAQYVDVIGVDYYNQYPYVDSPADWSDSLTEVDGYGAPKGLQQHLEFARSVGLPLAVPEWSGHAQNGDSPAFIQGMHDFFAANAGGGAGQLLYEIQFNIDMHEDAYRVFPSSRMPNSAELYRELF